MSDPHDGIGRELSGERAEATELGEVATKLLEFFEQIDLPESIKDARLVVLLDTEDQGIFAGSEGYETDPKADGWADLTENTLRHVKVMLRQGGIAMEVMDASELKARMTAFGGGDN